MFTFCGLIILELPHDVKTSASNGQKEKRGKKNNTYLNFSSKYNKINSMLTGPPSGIFLIS